MSSAPADNGSGGEISSLTDIRSEYGKINVRMENYPFSLLRFAFAEKAACIYSIFWVLIGGLIWADIFFSCESKEIITIAVPIIVMGGFLGTH